MTSTTLPAIVELTDAELDAVAGGNAQVNLVGAILAFQTNISAQTSLNVITVASGNQLALQSNNVSVGG